MTTTPMHESFQETTPSAVPLPVLPSYRFSNKAAAFRATSSVWLERHAVLRDIGVLALTFLVVTVLVDVFNRMIPTFEGWAIIWPFNALIIALFLMSPRRRWPWILAGFACAFVRIEFLRSEPLSEILVDVGCNTAEILASSLVLPRFHSLKTWMMQPRLFVLFTLFAVLIVPLSTSLPVAWYYNGHPCTHLISYLNKAFGLYMVKWGFTDALGIALWVPLVLVLFSRETYRLFRWRSLPETVALLGTLFAATWFTFSQQRYPVAFLPYPILLLIALRLGFSGAVIGANLLALVSASLSLHGHGPFISTAHAWGNEQTVILQIYSALAMFFVLPLSVMLIERQNFADRLQQAYADMKQLATIDTLTGVSNRRRFDDSLTVEWNRAVRGDTPIALLMIDADCFKSYNDRYGHIAGDACLRQIAGALSAEPLRPQDLVARYGGEEFAVLLPGASPRIVEVIAESIRARVYDLKIPHSGNPQGRVTISVGCASIVPCAAIAAEELISTADSALYAAKAGGRNRVQTSVSTPQAVAVDTASFPSTTA